MATKAMVNVQGEIDVVLGCSVNTNTALYSVNGHSPNKLVFGRNPNILTVMNNWPPALEKVSTSELVVHDVNIIHAARLGDYLLKLSLLRK